MMSVTLGCHFLFHRWVWVVTKTLRNPNCSEAALYECPLLMHTHSTKCDTSLLLGFNEKPLFSRTHLDISRVYPHVFNLYWKKNILGRDNSFFFLMTEQKGHRMPLFMLRVPIWKEGFLSRF